MAVHSKTNPDISSSSSSSNYSLSFSGFVTSKDRQPDKMIKTRDHGFKFGSSVANHYGDQSLPKLEQTQISGKRRDRLIVRNHSIRRGGQRITEEEEESSWSGWNVFRSFVSPCRECRASKPAVVEARPVRRA